MASHTQDSPFSSLEHHIADDYHKWDKNDKKCLFRIGWESDIFFSKWAFENLTTLKSYFAKFAGSDIYIIVYTQINVHTQHYNSVNVRIFGGGGLFYLWWREVSCESLSQTTAHTLIFFSKFYFLKSSFKFMAKLNGRVQTAPYPVPTHDPQLYR